MPDIMPGELLDPAFRPFAVAAAIIVLVALIEIVSAVLGLTVSDALDNLLPDVDLETDGGALGWLGFGHAPFLVVVIVILSGFSITGIFVQVLALAWLGFPLWPVAAVGMALLVSLPLSAWVARRLGRWIPGVETSGIHRDELIGREGRVTTGTATRERSAEAEVVGPKGLRHWIRIRAETGETIRPGERVRILERADKVLFVARSIEPGPPGS